MVIVAHPDDIDFGMAGTAGALVDAGAEVSYCLVSSGEAGIPEDMDRDELREMRIREQTAAAAAVGVSDLLWLGQPDGALVADLHLRKVISQAIREVKPDLVLTQSPERRWDRAFASHPDHLAVAEATMAAVYPDARNPHAHPELAAAGHEPHAVNEVWVGMLEPVDVFVDISAVIDRKIKALSSHTSQVSWISDVDALLRGWAIEMAEANGLPAGSMIESFRRVTTG
ncbi:MAG: PIG-L family deacetylase [Acidobacteria bacterium]|nr:PIG-L family deacetylase [Acidobacteriota bacterium]